MTTGVVGLTRHYADGLTVSDDLPLDQKIKVMAGRKPSPLVRVTWMCDSKPFELNIKLRDGKALMSVSKLPDSSGLICFEDRYAEDNCLLLDVYGNERMRLTVPWELTGNEGIPPEMRQHGKPKPKKMWFIGLATPWSHPKTGEPGKLGVTAHLEYGEGPYDYHDYYFELDWQTGDFLWGRPIRI